MKSIWLMAVLFVVLSVPASAKPKDRIETYPGRVVAVRNLGCTYVSDSISNRWCCEDSVWVVYRTPRGLRKGLYLYSRYIGHPEFGWHRPAVDDPVSCHVINHQRRLQEVDFIGGGVWKIPDDYGR